MLYIYESLHHHYYYRCCCWLLLFSALFQNPWKSHLPGITSEDTNYIKLTQSWSRILQFDKDQGDLGAYRLPPWQRFLKSAPRCIPHDRHFSRSPWPIHLEIVHMTLETWAYCYTMNISIKKIFVKESLTNKSGTLTLFCQRFTVHDCTVKMPTCPAVNKNLYLCPTQDFQKLFL